MLTSGAFARRSRLSPKALRLYHDMGLLRPAKVDPTNGYRYYGDGQVEQARLIGLLRSLEMPLAEIAGVITLDAPEAIEAIGEHWRRVDSDHKAKRDLVRFLVNHLSGKGTDMFEVEERDVPEQRVASIEEHVLAGALPAFIDRGMASVYELLTEAGVTTGIPFVVYHGEVNLDSDGPVEVCVPYEGAIEPRGAVRMRVEPAHRAAFTRISKGQVQFPQILEAYAAVETWAQTRGYSTAAAP